MTLAVNIFTKMKFGKDLSQSYKETGLAFEQYKEMQNWKDPVRGKETREMSSQHTKV